MGLNKYLGGFLAHRVVLLQVKKKYALNPNHCDILLLINGLTPGSALINLSLLKAYSTGVTSYYCSKWVYSLLDLGYVYDSREKKTKYNRNNYRLTPSGQSIVDYIERALHDRVKYTNDKMKIAEGLKRDRWKEQTKRKTAAARLRREKARLDKLNNSLVPPPAGDLVNPS